MSTCQLSNLSMPEQPSFANANAEVARIRENTLKGFTHTLYRIRKIIEIVAKELKIVTA